MANELEFYEEGTRLLHAKPKTTRFVLYFFIIILWFSWLMIISNLDIADPSSTSNAKAKGYLTILNFLSDHPVIYFLITFGLSVSIIIKNIQNSYPVFFFIEDGKLFAKRKNGILIHMFWNFWFDVYEIEKNTISTFYTGKKNSIEIIFNNPHPLTKNIQECNIFIEPSYSSHTSAIVDFLNENYTAKGGSKA